DISLRGARSPRAAAQSRVVARALRQAWFHAWRQALASGFGVRRLGFRLWRQALASGFLRREHGRDEPLRPGVDVEDTETDVEARRRRGRELVEPRDFGGERAIFAVRKDEDELQVLTANVRLVGVHSEARFPPFAVREVKERLQPRGPKEARRLD